MCGGWVKRMWGHEKSAPHEVLTRPTEIFDDCGAYDIKEPDAPLII